MFMTRLRSMAAASVIALAALAAPVAEVRAADLFTAVAEPPPSGPLADTTLRRRVVAIDFGQLQRAQATVVPRETAVVARQPAPDRAVADRTDKPAPEPAPGATLTFNLFDDTVVTGIVERTAPAFSGGYSLAGRIEGEPLGTMVLVVNGETVAGSVRLVGETYRIRSVDDGLYAISEVEARPLDCGVQPVPLE